MVTTCEAVTFHAPPRRGEPVLSVPGDVGAVTAALLGRQPARRRLGGHRATRGGCSDIDMKDPPPRALGASGSPAVTMPTPVGGRPRTWRKFS